MGNTTKETSKKFVKQPRKVTFTVTKKGNTRIFTPVNKRAKSFAAIAGTATLTSKNLKGIKKLGYKVAESPSLKAIEL